MVAPIIFGLALDSLIKVLSAFSNGLVFINLLKSLFCRHTTWRLICVALPFAFGLAYCVQRPAPRRSGAGRAVRPARRSACDRTPDGAPLQRGDMTGVRMGSAPGRRRTDRTSDPQQARSGPHLGEGRQNNL